MADGKSNVNLDSTLDDNLSGETHTLSESLAEQQARVNQERAATFDKTFYAKWNYPDFPTFYRALGKSVADPNFHLTPQEGGYHVNGNGDVSELGAILYPTINNYDLYRLKQDAKDITANVEQMMLDVAFANYNESLSTKAEMIENALREIERNPVDGDQTVWTADIQKLKDRRQDIQLQEVHILEDAQQDYETMQEEVRIVRSEIDQQPDSPLFTEPLWSYHPEKDARTLTINSLRDLIPYAKYERESRENVAYRSYDDSLISHRMANGKQEDEQVYKDQHLKELDAIAKEYDTFNQALLASPAGMEQIKAFYEYTKTGIYANSSDGEEPTWLTIQDIEKYCVSDTAREQQPELDQKQAQGMLSNLDGAEKVNKPTPEEVQQDIERERSEENQLQQATEEYATYIRDAMAHGKVASDKHLLLDKTLTTAEALSMRQEAIAVEKVFGNHKGLEKAFLEQWSDKIASVERHSTSIQQKAFLNKESLALKDMLAPIYNDMQAEKYGIQNDKAFSKNDIEKVFSNGDKTSKEIYASIQAHRNEAVLDWGYTGSKSEPEIMSYVRDTNDILTDQLSKEESYFLDTTGKEVIAKQLEDGGYEVSTINGDSYSLEIMSEKEAGAYLIRENMIAVDKDSLEYANKALAPKNTNIEQTLTKQQEKSVARSL